MPEPRLLSLYKSSAGSGKTYTLVKEYLRLCLPRPERFRSIIALTFTRAAAAEMKDRILRKLEDLADGSDAGLAHALKQEGLTEEDLGNAGKVLQNILHGYSFFAVGTIDSFFHRILRAFGRELGLPFDFQVSLDADELLEFAVDRFLYRSYQDEQVQALLTSYIRERISDGKGWRIKQELLSMAKELLHAPDERDFHFTYEEMAVFIESLREQVRSYEVKMQEYGRRGVQAIEGAGFSLDDFKYKSSSAANAFYKLAAGDRKYEFGLRFTRGAENKAEWLGKDAPQPLEDLVENTLMPLAGEVLKLYEVQFVQYQSARSVLATVYTFAVYREIHQELERYKEEHDLLLISDFNKIISKHLRDEPVSYIYSRIGTKYEHFLLDEFQDTSMVDWGNLKPLVENAVSQGNACLVVGDAKQSIYRWRGGYVELIDSQIAEVDFPMQVEIRPLDRNWRSMSEVINFNNRFFERVNELWANDLYESKMLRRIFGEEAVRQQATSATPKGGHVQVNFIGTYGLSKKYFRDRSVKLCLEAIQKAREDGYRLRDIAILIRRKGEAPAIADALGQAGIDFITNETLYLDHSPKVRFLLSALNFLSDTRNVLARTELSLLYLRYLKPEGEENPSFQELFNDFKNLEDGLFHRLLPEEFVKREHSLATLPLYGLVEELIRIFSLHLQPDAYIHRFQEVVFEFVAKEQSGIRAFMEFWQDGKFTVVMPEDQDAVQIMTIHKAKGLEFPVVIIPFADWEFRSREASTLWVEAGPPYDAFSPLPVKATRQLGQTFFASFWEREEMLSALDNLNLIYVAFTRAQDRLHVSTTFPLSSSSRRSYTDDSDGPRSVSDIIRECLKPELSPHHEYAMTFGEATPNRRSYKVHANRRQLEHYPAVNWRTRDAAWMELNRMEQNRQLRMAILNRDAEDAKRWQEDENEAFWHHPLTPALWKQEGRSALPGLILPGAAHVCKPAFGLNLEDKIVAVFFQDEYDNDLSRKNIRNYILEMERRLGRKVEAWGVSLPHLQWAAL